MRRTLLTAVALTCPVPLAARQTGAPPSELRDTVELYAADLAALGRRYDVDYSPARRTRLRAFHTEWRGRLKKLSFDRLGLEGKVDYVLLDGEQVYRLAVLDREDRLWTEVAPWLTFAGPIMDLAESRRKLAPVDGATTARTLTALTQSIDSARLKITPANATRPSKVVARRVAGQVEELRQTLKAWHDFSAGYDPLFSWWTADPYQKADKALEAYLKFLRETVVGIKKDEPEPIIGDPIGAEGLRADLAHELIPYTVEELIAIAEREYAWCEAELKKAAKDMGFGDDWKAALEKVKQTYVPPGQQPQLIRDLALEAITFVESRNLVTVPALAKEIWRMEMLSPERQRVSPFFLGGEVFRVSYPTDAMAHEDKLMSMRGNNPHFSRSTAHHELIPGHHLQGFMTSRYNTHRRVFATPFWGEGWALYWEFLLWDLGFPRGPEDKMGMLFWRTHRAARIIFSLRFHMGTMTPQEAVDFLVDKVGHERANAEGEVRRSFAGDYEPLYQAAYMLGGLQIYALHRELVGSKRMTDRQFHDAILQGGRMPIEMVRARLLNQPPARDYTAKWKFAEPRPAR